MASTLIQTLEELSSGALSASAAREALSEVPGDAISKNAARIYASFRAWTWKALDSKRRDPELKDWHDLLKRVQARLRERQDYSARLEVLQELIYESINAGDKREPAEVLKRRHARELLEMLASARRGLPRMHLMRRLRLNQSNISRVLGMLIAAGLVERDMRGREALFRLSRSGMELVSESASASRSPDPFASIKDDFGKLIEKVARPHHAPHDVVFQTFKDYPRAALALTVYPGQEVKKDHFYRDLGEAGQMMNLHGIDEDDWYKDEGADFDERRTRPTFALRRVDHVL